MATTKTSTTSKTTPRATTLRVAATPGKAPVRRTTTARAAVVAPAKVAPTAAKPAAATTTATPLMANLTQLPLNDTNATAAQLRTMRVTPAEFAPAFLQLAKTNQAQAKQFTAAFASTMETNDQLRGMFDQVARAKPADRRLAFDGMRAAGQARRIVHAVGLMPAAHGQVLMKDFLLNAAGKRDDASMREAAAWLADAGEVITARAPSYRRPTRDMTPPSSAPSRTSPTPSSTPSRRW